ncbi:MAG: 2-C-methyl-D-erythritol 4-phosphate cytidylyltransferase [Alistipes sp.]|nr:2-C-methyl-D-erythritol 4-phosphate cytidylyltransferase [Alistipes sp.]
MDIPPIKISVVIVAGGSGRRMGGEIPKQFLLLGGKEIIVHSVERFRKAIPCADIYIALGEGMEGHWARAARRHGLENCILCKGGPTRFHTVANSLAVMPECDVVLVHDAVRPLVDEKVIEGVVKTALRDGAAVPAVIPVDSFRVCEGGDGSRPVDRNLLRAVQTPQGFRYHILSQAYRRPCRESFTDDAQVVEGAGHKISLCDGSPLNIKLTYPGDIPAAEAILLTQNDQ